MTESLTLTKKNVVSDAVTRNIRGSRALVTMIVSGRNNETCSSKSMSKLICSSHAQFVIRLIYSN
jgi:hypothetical protein